MGTGWRRAFCTTIPRESEESIADDELQSRISQNASPEPIRSCVKLGIFSSISSNPSTPKLRCRTGGFPEPQSADNTPKLRCKTPEKKPMSPKRKIRSTPSSPRSPFAMLKTALRISKSGCGVCLQSVKTGQGMAIYTAECSHSFHFPCITQLVRKQGSMVCPVCNFIWKEVPLLFQQLPEHNGVVEKTITTSSTSATRSHGGIFQVDDRKLQSSMSAVKTKQGQSKTFDHSGRSYNDDESLLSPTAGVRFNPIPEAEDEDDEDAAEFQGFFVNPTPSTPNKNSATASVYCGRNHGSVEVKLLPEAAVVSVGRSHETFAVALRVKAPPLSAAGGASSPALLSSHRSPVDLVTVLDVSGNMNSGKLQMLKRAMRLVISSLGSSDRLSIITFCDSPQRLLPLRRMSHQGQRLARRIVDHLAIGEGKSVASAMKLAAKVLEDRREKNPVASIILLSDGQNQSTSESNQRHSKDNVSFARFGHVEIPVSSFGYGGSNNQDSVADAFAKRVGGLLSVVVQDLRLQLGFSSGEITAVYSSNGRPTLLRSESIRLGDLYAEEERELLVELRVPTSAIGSHHVLSVRCSYIDPATGEAIYLKERALLVPRPHAVRSSDPRIERLRNVFLATKAVAETRRLVDQGDYGSAQHLLVSVRKVVAQSSSASAEEYVRLLEAELASIQLHRQQCNYKVRQQPKVATVDQQRRRKGDHHVAFVDENGEPLTPTSAWRAAEQLAKLATMKKALNRSKDLHGFENARF
ncbi:hypothetical protein V2J09_023872 [Rumex salicifolius]